MTVPAWPVRRVLLALVVAGSVAACSSEPASEPDAASTAEAPVAPKALEEATAKVFEETETHADQPPHGGKIVPLGAHVAHAEVVLVPDTGELTVYILDAEGQPGQRIAQPVVLVDVETSGRTVRLELAASPLDGERSGDASRFTARSDDLLRMAEGKATLRWVGVNGQVFSDVVVSWP
ncbi:hypothetical protein TBR22_A20070 [Luteitalea sp. TBR-22]|uniref:hypothetical protein n=1 Tax=Luteitalea sp. TBR-22 TaxID=2802971 RepID=UPI001AF7D740|nr:hypothetical protein [Luteitalea sp. TBR-22]BCS32785.1 hypothetical protein TBR22_A20070 [Luteitalea sp. TBR-22]